MINATGKFDAGGIGFSAVLNIYRRQSEANPHKWKARRAG